MKFQSAQNGPRGPKTTTRLYKPMTPCTGILMARCWPTRVQRATWWSCLTMTQSRSWITQSLMSGVTQMLPGDQWWTISRCQMTQSCRHASVTSHYIQLYAFLKFYFSHQLHSSTYRNKTEWLRTDELDWNSWKPKAILNRNSVQLSSYRLGVSSYRIRQSCYSVRVGWTVELHCSGELCQ